MWEKRPHSARGEQWPKGQPKLGAPSPSRLLAIVVGLLLCTALTSFRTRAAHAEHAIGVCSGRFSLSQQGSTLKVPYCSNKSLASGDSTVTRVVVVVHGNGRSAPDYYSYIEEAARSAGSTNTLIVAPQFLTIDDLHANSLPPEILYWSSSGWKQGDLSRSSPDGRPWRMSSFTVLDKFIEHVSNRSLFPNLRQVVVAGHSAGGQFATRYAAGTRVQQRLSSLGNRYRYVVANPSSYLYLNGSRRKPNSVSQFGPLTSTQRSKCGSYDQYKYGLSEMNSYMAGVGSSAIREQFKGRNVVYLLGSLDTDTTDDSMDTTCAANWQGANRLERGTIYHNYLGYYYGSTVYKTHVKSIVVGVGHDGQAMFTSAAARPHLFGP